jgi:hypothetical protein
MWDLDAEKAPRVATEEENTAERNISQARISTGNKLWVNTHIFISTLQSSSLIIRDSLPRSLLPSSSLLLRLITLPISHLHSEILLPIHS